MATNRQTLVRQTTTKYFGDTLDKTTPVRDLKPLEWNSVGTLCGIIRHYFIVFQLSHLPTIAQNVADDGSLQFMMIWSPLRSFKDASNNQTWNQSSSYSPSKSPSPLRWSSRLIYFIDHRGHVYQNTPGTRSGGISR